MVVQFSDNPLEFVIVVEGAALSRVVETDEVAVHPLDPVTVTVNVPAVVTLMDDVVAPVLQE